jgi:hypothetical protein
VPDEVTNLDVASRCPKCDQVGETVSSFTNPTKKYGTALVLECKTETCSWFETRYVIQVDKDGNVPVRPASVPEHEKIAPAMNPGFLAMGQQEVEQLAAEPKEIRSPHDPR